MIKCWMPLSRNTLNSGLSVLHTENSGATNSEVGGCKCYVFDGESGIKINEELVSNLSQLSVSFWIYQTGTTTVGNAFSFEVSTYWQFTVHNGLLYVRDNGGTDLSTFSIGSITKNRWIYLVFTYDHGNISIYKDGELTTTGQTEGTALNNGITNNWIGRCQQGGNFFLDGYIRDFRVYDHVLSDDDIQRINMDLVYEFNGDMNVNSITHITKSNVKSLRPTRKHHPWYDYFDEMRNNNQYFYHPLYMGCNSVKYVGEYMITKYPILSGYEFTTKHLANKKSETLINFRINETVNENDIISIEFDAIQIHSSPGIEISPSVLQLKQNKNKYYCNIVEGGATVVKPNINNHISLKYTCCNKGNRFLLFLKWRRNYTLNCNPSNTAWNDIYFKNFTIKKENNSLPQKTYYFDKSGILSQVPKQIKLHRCRFSTAYPYFITNDYIKANNKNVLPYNISLNNSFVIKFKLFNNNKERSKEIFVFRFNYNFLLIYFTGKHPNDRCVTIHIENKFYRLNYIESFNDFTKEFHTLVYSENKMYLDGQELHLINSCSYSEDRKFNGYISFIKIFNKNLPQEYINCISYKEKNYKYSDSYGISWSKLNICSDEKDFNENTSSEYFSFGETSPKNAFSIQNYKFWDGEKYTKYNSEDNLIYLQSEDDAATVNYGNGWETPSIENFYDLFNCNKTYIASTGVCVLIKKSGQKLFFPFGEYLTKNMEENFDAIRSFVIARKSNNTHYGDFNKLIYFDDVSPRYYGLYVRPIKKHYEVEYVDLDLPSGTLWATCNIGTEYSDYKGKGLRFAWGDTLGYKTINNHNFNSSNYKYSTTQNGLEKYTKYCQSNKPNLWGGIGNPDNKVILEKQDDAAFVRFGENWQIPSLEQFEELLDNTIKIDSEHGVLLLGENGNSIFLQNGTYWSNLLTNNPGLAYSIHVPYNYSSSNPIEIRDTARYLQGFIRPVHS